jgi:hypothetical protein
MNVIEPQELSSDVILRLRAGGKILRVGQVCDKVLYLREVRATPPGDAELLITVNGRTEVHPIFLPHGIDDGSETVNFF